MLHLHEARDLNFKTVSSIGAHFYNRGSGDLFRQTTYYERFTRVHATNSLVECTNLSLGEGIKARLDKPKGRWVEELSHVLWAHHTMIKVSTRDTPFSLIYGTEAVIPTEIGMPAIRTTEVPRSENKKADALSKIASTSFTHLSKQVLVEILKNKSISEMEISTVIEEQNPMWMTPIIEFISKGTLPYELKDARRIRRKAQRFELQDAGGLKFLIVAIDYFTKWIEAKAVATITGNQVKRFVWENIVCRFGLPGEIISDNGKQLCDNPFKDWCVKLNITQHFTSVKHPQTNGLVECTNLSLGEGIKARLDKHKGRWVEELSHVLWAHRTMIKVSTRDTPFSLVYGTEAVIPTEIGMPAIRTTEVNVATNGDERRIDLDLLEERRERVAICKEKAKLKMKGYYDAK
nr:reverse transcriptase domain-containing protein [Tanacetum cinerariifolium]